MRKIITSEKREPHIGVLAAFIGADGMIQVAKKSLD